MTGGVYLIQPCQLKGTNRYKIGMSKKDLDKRIKLGYLNGTVILRRFYCKYPLIVEKYIKEEFNENFENCGGHEYFQGEEQKMVRVFIVSFWEKADIEYQGKLHAAARRIQEFWRLCRLKLHAAARRIQEFWRLCRHRLPREKIPEYKLYYFERWKRLHEKYKDPPPYIIKTSEEWMKFIPDMHFIITNRKKEEGYVKFMRDGTWNKFSLQEAWGGGEDLKGWIYHNRPNVYKMISPGDELVSSDKMCEMTANYINSKTNQEITYEEFIKLDRKDMEDYEQQNYNWARSKNNKYRFGPAEYDIDEIHKDILKKNYISKKNMTFDINNRPIMNSKGEIIYVSKSSSNVNFTRG